MNIKKYNDRNIKDVLHEFLHSHSRITKGFNTARLNEIWKSEMGPVIASYTSKISLKDGVMRVYITSAPLRKELHMGSDKIIRNINEAAGTELIKAIEFF